MSWLLSLSHPPFLLPLPSDNPPQYSGFCCCFCSCFFVWVLGFQLHSSFFNSKHFFFPSRGIPPASLVSSFMVTSQGSRCGVLTQGNFGDCVWSSEDGREHHFKPVVRASLVDTAIHIMFSLCFEARTPGLLQHQWQVQEEW